MATEAALEVVVLAAGAGSRFGGGKLMSPWRGGLLLDAALAAAFAAPARSVSVAWGADARIPDAAQAFAAQNRSAGPPAAGSRRTRRRGHGRVAEGGDRRPTAGCLRRRLRSAAGRRAAGATLANLAEALVAGHLAAAPSFEGRRGHPVLFAAALFSRLLALAGDKGAASVLAGLGEALTLVPVTDDGVLFDIDRPDDLR